MSSWSKAVSRSCYLAVAVALGLGACASEEVGTAPPRGEFYFPASTALDFWRDPATGQADPSRPILLVANNNADLRFNGGTVTVVDIQAVPRDFQQLGAQVQAGGINCSADPLEVDRWQCPETELINPSATLRIGDFAGGLRVGSKGRLYTAVRGQNNLTWADVVSLSDGSLDLRCNDDPVAGCGAAGDADCNVWDCDEAHSVAFSQRLAQSLPEQPFGLVLNEQRAVHVTDTGERRTCVDGRLPRVNCACDATPLCALDDPAPRSCCVPAGPVDHVYVTHLENGGVSFFASQPGRVVLRDIVRSVFNLDDNEGSFGLAPLVPGDGGSPVYVSSRRSTLLGSFVVQSDQDLVTGAIDSLAMLRTGDGMRGIVRGVSGRRLYVLARRPALLVALDLTQENGRLRPTAAWTTEICNEPSSVALGPNPERPDDTTAELAYVVCFGDAVIHVVDTVSGQLVDRIQTGSGPNDLVLDVGSLLACENASQCAAGEQCVASRCQSTTPRAFIANFVENTIGLIDLQPSSTSFRQMKIRLGTRRDLVGEE